MFFEFFDWKIKLGILLTVGLGVSSVISFILAWTAPTPTDVFTAIDQFLLYRWFAFFTVSTFSIGVATHTYYYKHLSRMLQ